MCILVFLPCLLPSSIFSSLNCVGTKILHGILLYFYVVNMYIYTYLNLKKNRDLFYCNRENVAGIELVSKIVQLINDTYARNERAN